MVCNLLFFLLVRSTYEPTRNICSPSGNDLLGEWYPGKVRLQPSSRVTVRSKVSLLETETGQRYGLMKGTLFGPNYGP